MSKDVTPEWLRLKREIEASMRGVWHTIFELWDRQEKLEKKVEQIEDDLQSK